MKIKLQTRDFNSYGVQSDTQNSIVKAATYDKKEYYSYLVFSGQGGLAGTVLEKIDMMSGERVFTKTLITPRTIGQVDVLNSQATALIYSTTDNTVYVTGTYRHSTGPLATDTTRSAWVASVEWSGNNLNFRKITSPPGQSSLSSTVDAVGVTYTSGKIVILSAFNPQSNAPYTGVPGINRMINGKICKNNEDDKCAWQELIIRIKKDLSDGKKPEYRFVKARETQPQEDVLPRAISRATRLNINGGGEHWTE